MKALFALMLLTAGLHAQTYEPPKFVDSDREAKTRTLMPEVDKLAHAYAKAHDYPGFAYGVIMDGKLIHVGYGGYLDLNKKTAVQADSLFRVASMTKSLTTMAILKLRDEGKLRLDDPVKDYIPEIGKANISEDAPVITVRDLMVHTAGFPYDDPWGDRNLDMTDSELEAVFEEGFSLSTPPGTAYEYSNLGYTMLGVIVQKVSGMKYQDYVTQNVLEPIGAEDFYWEFSDIKPERRAHGYKKIADQWVEQEILHDGALAPMAGLIASVESFSRYAQMHIDAYPARDGYDNGPVKRSTLREMHQPHRFMELITKYPFNERVSLPLSQSYGYGLIHQTDGEGRQFVGHSGGLPGFGSNWNFMPEYGLGVIFFTNATYADAQKINLQMLDFIVTKAELKPRVLPPSKELIQKRDELIKMFPQWNKGEKSGIFASNFFGDYNDKRLKKFSKELLKKSGKIVSVGDVEAENLLAGSFILYGEKGNLKIRIALNPENPALIQHYRIQEV